MRYELINYDVWGNAREGFWVNNAFHTHQYVDIPEDASDGEIIRILKDEGIIKKSARYGSIRIDGESGYNLYFTHAPTERPEFELLAVRDDLSGCICGPRW